MKIEEIVYQYVNDKRIYRSKKRLNITELEEYVQSLLPNYYDHGGYTAFYEAIKKMEMSSVITPLKTKLTNSMSPSLAKFYWIQPHESPKAWTSLQMIEVSDILDLSYYKRNIQYQTEEEWNNIKKIYYFLKDKDNRLEISLAERSFELFGDEKYLKEKSLRTVSRLGLDLNDIKAKVNYEPFVFWLKTNTQLQDVKDILIVENLSFFHTAVSLLENGLLRNDYQVIIYGEGKHIENSFRFFYQMFPGKSCQFQYAGDMDPEGYNIYSRLANKEEHALIRPAAAIYREMIKYKQMANTYEVQDENQGNRDYFLQMLVDDDVSEVVLDLWRNKQRIPQEVLTIETWR